jgi:hypothetical protein
MTREEQDLLIKDLCSRLPYGIFVLGMKHINAGMMKKETIKNTIQLIYT